MQRGLALVICKVDYVFLVLNVCLLAFQINFDFKVLDDLSFLSFEETALFRAGILTIKEQIIGIESPQFPLSQCLNLFNQ